MTTYDPTIDEAAALLDMHTSGPATGCHGCGSGPARTWPGRLRWCARCEPMAGAPLNDWSDQ